VAVTAAVHQDIDPVGHGHVPGTKKIKKVFGSAREGHRVYQPLPGNPVTMQNRSIPPAFYKRESLSRYLIVFPKIPVPLSGFSNYRVKIQSKKKKFSG
jgi:hypothetical protein